MPDAWRVTVKINDSGDDNILIRGAGKIAFDQRGYARVTKNTFQDTPCSSNCNLVFNPHVQSVDGLFYNTDGFSNNAAGDHALESAVAKSVGEPALVPGSR